MQTRRDILKAMLLYPIVGMLPLRPPTIQDQVAEYFNNLNRYLALEGISIRK